MTRSGNRGILFSLTNLNLLEVLTILLLMYVSVHGVVPVLMPRSDLNEPTTSEAGVGIWLQAGFLLVITILVTLSARSILRRVGMLYWPLLLPACALASTFWSQEPGTTLRKAVILLVTSLFAVFIHCRFSFDEQLRLFVRFGIAVAIASVVLCVLFPSYGLDQTLHVGAWQGIFPQKNICARACVFILIAPVALLNEIGSRKALALLACVLLLLVTVMTESRTGDAIAIALVGAIVVLRFARRLGKLEIVLAILSICILTPIACLVASSYTYDLVTMLGRDLTFSGRTAIWRGVWDAIMKQPFLGYGYSAFWLGMKGESANVAVVAHWFVPAAHNGFLELWLQLGALGMILFLLTLARLTRDTFAAWRNGGGAPAIWCAGIILLTLIYNIDESSFLIPNELLWVLYVLAMLNAQALRAKVPQKAQRTPLARHQSGEELARSWGGALSPGPVVRRSSKASTGRDSAPPDERGTSTDLGAGRESVVLRSSSKASTGRDSAPPDERGTSTDLGAGRESVVLRSSLEVDQRWSV